MDKWCPAKPDLTDSEVRQEAGCSLSDPPKGVLVGTVEIVDCIGSDGEHEWILANPERLDEPLKPTAREQLAHLSDQVGDNRSLLVMCAAFRVRSTEAFPNLNIKKIPHTVLTRCESGNDDYSLEIKNLPAASPPPEPNAPPNNTRASNKPSRTSVSGFNVSQTLTLEY